MQVLKVRMRIEVTRFRNCAAQFRNRVAILKSEDSFEIGTQFEIFKLRNANSKLRKFTIRAEHIYQIAIICTHAAIVIYFV